MRQLPGGVVHVLAAICEEAGPAAQPLLQRLAELRSDGTSSDDPRWIELYLDACHQRRLARLARSGEQLRRVVFTKHYDLGGSHYAYTEGQSDAQNERHFRAWCRACVSWSWRTARLASARCSTIRPV